MYVGHVQTSLSNAKRCASVVQAKVEIKSFCSLVLSQHSESANHCHLKSLRHFIESSLPFRDRKEERGGEGGEEGGGREGKEKIFSASV